MGSHGIPADRRRHRSAWGWHALRPSTSDPRPRRDLLLKGRPGERHSRRPGVDQGRRGTPTGWAPPKSGMSGMVLSKPLQLKGKPVSRVENMWCHRFPRPLRAGPRTPWRRGPTTWPMAVGVEEGEGTFGVPGPQRVPPSRPTARQAQRSTAAAMFSMVRARLRREVRRRPGASSSGCWPPHRIEETTSKRGPANPRRPSSAAR